MNDGMVNRQGASKTLIDKIVRIRCQTHVRNGETRNIFLIFPRKTTREKILGRSRVHRNRDVAKGRGE
jgi:hypothetical protein